MSTTKNIKRQNRDFPDTMGVYAIYLQAPDAAIKDD
jgi:hypothetical protein